MRVHQPRREELIVQVMRLMRIVAAAARMDAGDKRTDDTHIRVSDLTGCHINNSGMCEQQIKRRVASCSHNGAASGIGSHAINSSSIEILTLLYAPGKRLPS